jgi:hypothetical protein
MWNRHFLLAFYNFHFGLRKYRRYTTKILTSSSNIMYLMSFRIYGKKGPLTTCPHVQGRDSNKRQLRRTSRQMERELRSRCVCLPTLIIWMLIWVDQMVRIDENQEAIALIRMAIDDDNRARTLQDVEDHAMELPREPELNNLQERHWTFGSCDGTRLDSRELERIFAPTDSDFIYFDERLRSFITHNFPEEAPRYEELIYVRSSI